MDDLLLPPGRFTRPPRLVVLLRGLPGAGKSHVARLIKERETGEGAEPPRVMALDDYFTTEGKYEYEEEMEEAYRSSLLKSFKKNIDGGYFPFLIVDAVNNKLDHFQPMWSYAKQNGFEVYICEVEGDIETCATRNIHSRTEAEIKKLKSSWEAVPGHMNTLDVTSLLQDAAIPSVDMADDDNDDEVEEVDRSPPPPSSSTTSRPEAGGEDIEANEEERGWTALRRR